MQDYPDSTAQVREALISAYAEINDVDVAVVSAGYDGGLKFDSLLGVELACEMEEKFGIAIPEDRLTSPKLYKSLAAFSAVVERSLREHKFGVAKQTSPQEALNAD